MNAYLLCGCVDGLHGSLVTGRTGRRHQARSVRQLRRVLVELVRFVREVDVSAGGTCRREKRGHA